MPARCAGRTLTILLFSPVGAMDAGAEKRADMVGLRVCTVAHPLAIGPGRLCSTMVGPANETLCWPADAPGDPRTELAYTDFLAAVLCAKLEGGSRGLDPPLPSAGLPPGGALMRSSGECLGGPASCEVGPMRGDWFFGLEVSMLGAALRVVGK